MHLRLVSFAVVLASLPEPAAAQVGVTPGMNVSVQLPGDGHDMAYDALRQRLYVSVPSANAVSVISTTNHQVLQDVIIAPRPSGIDISHDGQTLFIALNQGSAVAYLDLDTLQITNTVSVGAALENSLTWDVVEAKPDWVFVSANPSSGGFAKIALIRRDLGNAASTVASNRIIRAGPTFAKDPTRAYVYVGEGFSPNSLYKLDLSLPTAPIVLEDQHGAVGGTQHAEVSPDGSRIYLRSGQILDTQTFFQTGVIAAGPSRLEPTGSRAYVMTSSDTLEVFDTTTMLSLRSVTLPCPTGFFVNPTTLTVFPDEGTALALVEDRVCGITTDVAPSITGVDPARTRFDSGPVAVTIQGSLFDGGGPVSVLFGGQPATNIVIVNGNTITCTAPAGDPGPVDVEVMNNNGQDVLVDGFSYTPAIHSDAVFHPGGTAAFRLLNTTGDLILVFYGLGSPVSRTVPGLSGTLCLQQPVEWLFVPLWAAPEFLWGAAIPNDPGLVGFGVLVQAATASSNPQVSAFSNCVPVTIQ